MLYDALLPHETHNQIAFPARAAEVEAAELSSRRQLK